MPWASAVVGEGTACPVVTCDPWLVLPHRVALFLLLPDTLQKTAGIFIFETKELFLLSVCKQKRAWFLQWAGLNTKSIINIKEIWETAVVPLYNRTTAIEELEYAMGLRRKL